MLQEQVEDKYWYVATMCEIHFGFVDLKLSNGVMFSVFWWQILKLAF